MKRKFLSTLLGALGVFALVLFFAPESHAIGIRPLRYEVNVAPGESAEAEVTVVNNTDEDFFAEPSLSVFVANTEEGAPIYSYDEEYVEDILSWVEISDEPIFVPAKQTVDVTYTVNVPFDAEAGGKYILVGYSPLKDEDATIAVSVRAASVLIISVEGDVTPEGKISNFGLPNPLLSDAPLRFLTVFENTGNIHVKPQGWVTIRDANTGNIIKETTTYNDPATGEIVLSDELPVNLRLGNVLPASSRIFRSEWMSNVENGQYIATLNLDYDRSANSLSQEYPFEIDDNLIVDDFSIDITPSSADFNLVVTNEGNIYQRMIGKIVIENQFGLAVAEIPLPEDTEYVLPGEQKALTLNWLDKEIPPGGYTASLDIRYGLTDRVLNASVQFGEIDRTKLYLIIALVVAFLVVIFLLIKRRRGNSKRVSYEP